MPNPFESFMRSPTPAGNSGGKVMNAATTPFAGMHPTGIRSGVSDSVSLWTQRWSQAKAHQQLYEPDWARFWKWYRAWRSEMTDPLDWWRSNEVIPTCFKIIETLTPRYVLGMFDSPDYFNVRGTEASDEYHELAIEQLIRTKLEQMSLIPTTIDAFRYAEIMGHVWGKCVWAEEFRNRTVLQPTLTQDPLTGAISGVGMQKTKLVEKTFDGPRFSWIPLDRLKADPTGKGRWFIEEMDMSLDELIETDRRLGGVYSNLDQIALSTTSGVIAQSDFQEPQSTEGIPQQYVTPAEGPMVHLWQCWGWVPPAYRGPDGEEWRLTVIANRSLEIRDIPSPTPDGKPPYFGVKSISIPNRLYGDSILRYIGPLADQQSRIANHRLDEVMLNIWQQFVYDRRLGITDNEMLFQPGGSIGIDGDVDKAFRVLERRPTPVEAWREDDYRQTQMEHVSGATDELQGLSGTDRATAEEISTKTQQAGMRVTMQLLLLEETFKKELIKRVFELMQQRMPKDEIVRILASDGSEWDVTLDLSALQIPVDITVSGGLMGMSKQAKIALMRSMMEAGANPTFAPYLRPGAILQENFRQMGSRGVARFIKSDQEVQFEQLQMAGMGVNPKQGLGSGVAGDDSGGAAGFAASSGSGPGAGMGSGASPSPFGSAASAGAS